MKTKLLLILLMSTCVSAMYAQSPYSMRVEQKNGDSFEVPVDSIDQVKILSALSIETLSSSQVTVSSVVLSGMAKGTASGGV